MTYHEPVHYLVWNPCALRHTEAPGRGARGGGRPFNALQEHFSNSPNSGVKIAGGGGKADDLGNYNAL